MSCKIFPDVQQKRNSFYFAFLGFGVLYSYFLNSKFYDLCPFYILKVTKTALLNQLIQVLKISDCSANLKCNETKKLKKNKTLLCIYMRMWLFQVQTTEQRANYMLKTHE